jgi:hypothetical protein
VRGNPALAQIVISTASAASTALLFWLVRTLKKFMGEHEWLITTTKQHSVAIEQLLKDKETSPRRNPRRREP